MPHIESLILYHTFPTFNDPPRKKPFENIVGKGENAGDQHFLPFPQCFLPYHRQKSSFEPHLFSSANAFNLVMSKILLFGKELKQNNFDTEEGMGLSLASDKINDNLKMIHHIT